MVVAGKGSWLGLTYEAVKRGEVHLPVRCAEVERDPRNHRPIVEVSSGSVEASVELQLSNNHSRPGIPTDFTFRSLRQTL